MSNSETGTYKLCICNKSGGDLESKCTICDLESCNKCAFSPQLVKTDMGFYCTNCLETEDIILICPDYNNTPRNNVCNVCQFSFYDNDRINLVGKFFHRHCLDKIITTSYEGFDQEKKKLDFRLMLGDLRSKINDIQPR